MKYRVVGPRVVLGHVPGEVFEADLDPVQEARLVHAGHLKRADKDAAVGVPKPEEVAAKQPEPRGEPRKRSDS